MCKVNNKDIRKTPSVSIYKFEQVNADLVVRTQKSTNHSYVCMRAYITNVLRKILRTY